MGLFDFIKNKEDKNTDKYLSGFTKTYESLGKKLKNLTNDKELNKDEFIEKLMITLIEADLGYKTASKICDIFSNEVKNYNSLTNEELMQKIIEIFKQIYNKNDSNTFVFNENGPTVILMIGVNGSGKTSTCAKLAYKFINENKKVALVAADTFRAGAIEQLQKWSNELNINCISGKENQDPSSVLVDGCRYAKQNNIDILICDTAGRLQNKTNLMNELNKMYKVLNKEIDGAPHNCYLVIDANTGQNGVSQALMFNEICKIDGLVLTKIDGTSKGGIIFAIKDLIGVDVKYVGFGEKINDLEKFDFNTYLYSIIGELE